MLVDRCTESISVNYVRTYCIDRLPLYDVMRFVVDRVNCEKVTRTVVVWLYRMELKNRAHDGKEH